VEKGGKHNMTKPEEPIKQISEGVSKEATPVKATAKENQHRKKTKKRYIPKKTQKLSGKQKLFAQEYLVDLNATQAAIRAGYSKKTAGQQAARLLKNVKIQEELDKANNERVKRTQINQDVVIGELAKIALTDIKNYLSFRTEKTQVDTEDDGTPIIDYALVVDVKDSDEVDGSVISEVQLNKDGTFKFKLHDKKGALELLGKHLKLFTDKVEHSGEVDVEHDVSDEAIRAAVDVFYEKSTGVKATKD
jgi:phage terminase small subunit